MSSPTPLSNSSAASPAVRAVGSGLAAVTAGFVLLGASLQVQAALPKPYISGFTPTSGPVGTVVTVSGVRFSEVNKAWVGTRPATFSVINSTTIRLTVPTGAVTATIKVANPQFSSGSTAKFTVTATPPPPPPPTPPPVSVAPVDEHLVIDQFGYRPNDPKVAVIRNPQTGYDSNRRFTAGANYRVVRSTDNVAVFSGTPTVWNNGAIDPLAGDSGWWFDFSSVTTAGSYYILDADRQVRSPTFRIAQTVYRDALKASLRMYYYQRSGLAKVTPYAEACWTDGAAFLGTNQDSQARDVTDQANSAKVRDLRGGWFDAGDTNKYVTYAVSPVHQLLAAYEENPAVFTDDFSIPESGNGVPDVVDEVKWEVDWLKRMQNPDGSALLKVGQITIHAATPPSSDLQPRYYVPACTSSTIAVAGMFAHASLVYARFPALATEAADLKARAIAAYDRYVATPTKQTACDSQTVLFGDADLPVADQDNLQTVAAVYLYALTSDAKYHDRVKSSYRAMRPYNDIGWSRYLPEQGGALLHYTTLPNADATLKSTIRNDKLNDARNGYQVYGVNPNDDLYRAFLHSPQYHWGSNMVRGNYGNANREVAAYGIAVTDVAPYNARALDTLHYFHGVNPFQMVYLSNVNRLGPTHSLNTVYHEWFHDGDPKWDDVRSSSCGPAPGYIPAGPNAGAGYDVPSYLTPPTGQPAQKSFLEWNNVNERSYVITEPGIYYQSAYVKLVSSFAQ